MSQSTEIDVILCRCCGRSATVREPRVSGGHMHFGCWDEHHSDPTGPWPPEHVCSPEGGAS